MNTFGKIFTVTSFGESHGPAVGGVIDGMPAGVEIDLAEVQRELDRRKPGQSAITTARCEDDRVEVLSGLFEGTTTGAPVGFIIRNRNQNSADYDKLRDVFRPSHADYTYTAKYGIRDHRGGGRSSARETAVRVVAGAFAKQALAKLGVKIAAFTSQVGPIELAKPYCQLDLSLTESNAVRCPDRETAAEMETLILKVKSAGDTVGGVVSCVISGLKPGVGEPVFGRLSARLAEAMMNINAAKGFEYGMGFAGASRFGSEMNDSFFTDAAGAVRTVTNNSGGIQGGISNGEDIYFRVAFKPVATLLRDIETIDTEGRKVVLNPGGRHDPCVVPRAVPVVEAMAAITILDSYLLSLTSRL